MWKSSAETVSSAAYFFVSFSHLSKNFGSNADGDLRFEVYFRGDPPIGGSG